MNSFPQHLTRSPLKKQLKAITDFEKEVKDLKAALKRLRYELERKLNFKREGIDDERELLTNAIADKHREIESLQNASTANAKDKKARQKKIKDLEERKENYLQTLANLEQELEAIGGVITAEEARELILQKLHDLINNELVRYLNAEKRALVAAFEKLWDKYAVSASQIETEREQTVKTLDDFLARLGYLDTNSAQAKI